MMDQALLPSIVTIFALSIVVILFCDRLRLPPIVGYLVTGTLAGPHGFGLVNDIHVVDLLAEIGVVLLLFKIGMKLTVTMIASYKRFFFVTAPLQVFLTVAISFGVAQLLGKPVGESIFLGFLLSLSSTAIVFKIIEDRGETSSPQGKMMLGILIFQDIAAVMMILATPYLSFERISEIDYAFLWSVAKGFIVLTTVFIAASKLVPKMLYYIVKTKRQELFLLSLFTICFGVAWFAFSLGLTLSLGAFLAGMIIADSEYSTEAIGGVAPYQELLTSFFFVSIGMLFNLNFVFQYPIETIAITLGVLFMKTAVTTVSSVISGMPLRASLLTGIALSQIGEFSFVLLRFGEEGGIGTPHYYQLFLAVSVLTMTLTPGLIYLAPRFVDWVLTWPLPEVFKTGFSPLKMPKIKEEMEDHLIIVGFGFIGRHLAFASKQASIPYSIIDMSAELVRDEKKKGEPIHFGDATHDTVLEHLNIKAARVIAVLINDPLAAERIVGHARQLNPAMDILVRTRYVRQMPPLLRAGANEVIPEEFGTSVEIFSHVLKRFEASSEEIEKNINEMREEGLQVARHLFYQVEA